MRSRSKSGLSSKSISKTNAVKNKPVSKKTGAINLKKKLEEEPNTFFERPTIQLEGELPGGKDYEIAVSPFGSVEGKVEVVEFANGSELHVVAGVDMSPVNINLGYNPTTNNLSIGAVLGLPGDLVGVGGGVTIDLDTGEILGGDASVSAAGLSIEVDLSWEEGCVKILTVSVFGVGVSIVDDQCPPADENDRDDSSSGNDENDDNHEELLGTFGKPNKNTCVLYVCEQWAYSEDFRMTYENYLLSRKAWDDYQTRRVNAFNEGKHIFAVSFSIVGIFSVTASGQNLLFETPSGIRYSRGICSNGTKALLFRTGDEVQDITPSPRPRRPTFPSIPPMPGRRRKNMEKCCKATLSLIKKIEKNTNKLVNAVGSLEESIYPFNVEKENEDGTTETIQTDTILAYLKNGLSKQKVGPEVRKVGRVTGKIKKEENPIYPKKLIGVEKNDRPGKEFQVKNLAELISSIGDGVGYKAPNNPQFPLMFTLKDREGRITSKIYYSCLGELYADLGKALAPHKMLKGNGGKGFAIPNKIVFPGPEGYDFTDNYAGVLAGVFSAIEANGFQPVAVKVKDTNPGEKGDQTVEATFNNLSVAIKTLWEYGVDTSGEVDTQTNMLYRSLSLDPRLYQLGSRIWAGITSVIDGIGIDTETEVREIPLEIDPFAGKDADDKGDSQGAIDFHDEDRTEKLLPEFWKETVTQIGTIKASPGSNLKLFLLKLFGKNG